MDIYESKRKMESILTVESLAEYLRLHPSTIYRMLKGKQLPAFKLGREWRFNRESIDRWRADAELPVKQVGSTPPPTEEDNALLTPSNRTPRSAARPANQMESTSPARRPTWNVWPRVTDP